MSARLYTYRGHGFAIVVGDKAFEQRNGTLHFLLCQETQDTNLGETSVVELLDETACLLFFGFRIRKAKGVEEIEGDGVGDQFRVIRELGECAGFASTHVVCAGGLGEPLQKANEQNDLPLCSKRKGVPLFRRRAGCIGEWRAIKRSWPGKVDSVGLDNVSNKGSHGDTAVLDLRMAQKGNGGLIRFAPNGSRG